MPEINTRYGHMVVPDTAEDIVGAFLARYGEWAEFEVRFLADNLAEEDRVADIGAFVGTFGIGLSQKKRLESVCFVEANPLVVGSLRANVTANCHSSNTVIEALLCPSDYNPSQPHRLGNNQGSTSYAADDTQGPATDAPLNLQRMDFKDLWERYGPFKLIKLDVEGMELPILQDAKEYIARSPTTVWVECNDDPKSLQVADLLLSYGLNVYYYAFPSFNPDNFTRDPHAKFPFAYEAGLFGTHGEPAVDPTLISSGCILKKIDDSEALRLALWRTPRWVPAHIVSDRPEETIALATHALCGERYRDYLKAGESTQGVAATEWAPVADLRDQVRTLQESVRTLEEGVLTLEDKLQQQIKLSRWAEALASDRLMILKAERKRRLEAEQQYQSVAMSYSWRATKPVRALLARAPRLRTSMLALARPFVRMLRRR